MPQYVIEREIEGAGEMSAEELREVSLSSIATIKSIKSLGPEIRWLQSYVTDNKVYCVFVAPDEDAVRRHAEMTGLPVDRISRVQGMLDPADYE
jgi:hypothetical protein